MPQAIPRQCRASMCPETTTEPNGYCHKHQAKASGWIKPTRGSSTQRGYGGRWRRLRALIMERDKGLCQLCLPDNRVMPAVAVDHIVPKAEGGTDDEGNLQAICKRCHKLKTEMESKRARAGGGGQKFGGF